MEFKNKQNSMLSMWRVKSQHVPNSRTDTVHICWLLKLVWDVDHKLLTDVLIAWWLDCVLLLVIFAFQHLP